MQHSFGRQAATPKKVFFKIQVIYFNALDDFVTNHYDPSSLFMENPSCLSIQQFVLAIWPLVQIPLIMFGAK